MSSSNSDWLVAMCDTYGHRDVNVISPVVIVPICSHQMKMAGSGRDRAPKLDQPVNVIRAIGVRPADMVKHSPITVKRPKAMTNHVCPCWTTSTTMALNGMMWPAITSNRSSVKIPTNYWISYVHVIKVFVCRDVKTKKMSLTISWQLLKVTVKTKNDEIFIPPFMCCPQSQLNREKFILYINSDFDYFRCFFVRFRSTTIHTHTVFVAVCLNSTQFLFSFLHFPFLFLSRFNLLILF